MTAGGGIRTLVHHDVNAPPPDIVLARLLVHNPLVLRAAARLFAGEVDQRTASRDDGTLVADGILVEESRGGIALDGDPIHVEAGLREVLEVTAND